MYKVPVEKIVVLPEAAEEQFKDKFVLEEKEKFRREIGAKNGYILNYATEDAKENNEIVLKAWKKVLSQLKSPKKLIISGFPENQKIIVGIKERVRFLGFIEEEMFVNLYSSADVYVDILYYEGSGLRVVEAMACGNPVIVSNTTSLPEVVGNGGVLIDLNDYDGFTKARIDLLRHDIKCMELPHKAFKQAESFSQEETVSKTWKSGDRYFKTSRQESIKCK